MIKSLNALVGDKPKVLILGSIASRQSIAKNEFYAFRQNRFWQVMFSYFNTIPLDNYKEKCQLLQLNHIALWDSINECERENSSLDSKIKNVTPNDIESIITQNPSIKAIITNGKKSGEIYKKYFPCLNEKYNLNYHNLPSTSPANAIYSTANLLNIWSTTLKLYIP